MLYLNPRAKDIPESPLGEKMGRLKALALYNEIYEMQHNILGVKKSTLAFPCSLQHSQKQTDQWLLFSQRKML